MEPTRRNVLAGAIALSLAPAPVSAARSFSTEADPAIGLSQQLRAVWEAWMSAQDVYEEACQRTGFSICALHEMITVETSDGSACWSAREIKAAVEDGRNHYSLTPEQGDVALARLKRRLRKNLKRCRQLGIEPLWQEDQRLKAQFWDLHVRLLDMPAATSSGVLAKLRGFYHDGEIAQIRAGDDPDNDLPAEWAASVYRDLERLAGEARS